MASLSTLAFSDLVRGMATAVQAGAAQLLNLTVGSVLRAILEAIAGVILWLQGLVAYVLTLTRFSTSVGADADSWAADFGFTREPAVPSRGQVIFTRFTSTGQGFVPFGAVLQTQDGTQTFTVDTDMSNPAYNQALGGFTLANSISTLTLNVTCSTVGSGGNILANTITSIGQPIPGIDTVTNASAFTNGVDTESDAAFKARFLLYIAALSKATEQAVAAAIAGVQQGLEFTYAENFDYNGTYDPGTFYVVLDDGTGSPSSTLLNTVSAAIEAVRALGIRFAVFAPVITTANVDMTITSATGFDHATVVANVALALMGFINGLGLGNGLPFNQLAAVAFSVQGVSNASGITLNSATSDIASDPHVTIRAGTVDVA
jgi:uncharacterized phage protein gp47/JayE